MKILFWKNLQSGNYLSHHNGLTQELVDQLKQLKAGDRLILWVEGNKLEKNNPADLALKVFSSKEKK